MKENDVLTMGETTRLTGNSRKTLLDQIGENVVLHQLTVLIRSKTLMSQSTLKALTK